MDVPEKATGNLKDQVGHGLIEYAINVVYLALVFAAFTEFRRLVLASYDIAYTNYGFAVIQALVLGKVIMIGSVFRIGRSLEDKPLIYPTLWKTAVFVVFVGVFKLVEHVIGVMWHGEGLGSALADLSWEEFDVVAANSVVVLVAFIPFFAIKELERVYGRDKILFVFFQRVRPG